MQNLYYLQAFDFQLCEWMGVSDFGVMQTTNCLHDTLKLVMAEAQFKK